MSAIAATGSNLVACPACDLIFNVAGTAAGGKAFCTRCGELLTHTRHDAFERLQAFTLAGLIALGIACSSAFLSFESYGLESVMTLPQTAWRLYEQGLPVLAMLVAGFIIIIPAVTLSLLLVLSTLIKREQYFDWMIPLTRLVFHIQHWAMVEVFFIGVLVSLIKISSMATVVIGASFWAYGAFALLFILCLASLDRLQTWNELDRLAALKNAR